MVTNKLLEFLDVISNDRLLALVKATHKTGCQAQHVVITASAT